MKYRADVDGLRAVAVLSVIFYHLGFTAFPGGLVGVDIFFVISGFLIGGNVFQELEEGRFSFFAFYSRRLRRIVPALVVMLIGVTVAALVLFYPPTLIRYANSLVAAAASVSNIYFWRTVDYFAPWNFGMPLLHTWSLGVEEQFYLFFPVISVWLAGRPTRLVTIAFCGAAMLSLALAVVGIGLGHAAAAFYLLPTRIWEMLLGTLVARIAVPQLNQRVMRELVASFGLLAIVIPILFFSAISPLPGLAGLLPCIGTAAVIAAGRAGPSFATDALSWRPLVFLGLMSYSLYLWHWPVIELMQYGLLVQNLGPSETIFALMLTLVMGACSWRFVEQPFRSYRFSMSSIYYSAFASLGFVAIAGLAMIVARGLPQRFDPRAVKVASFLGSPRTVYRPKLCLDPPRHDLATFDRSVCLARSADKPNVLILGDSHAAHLWWGLHRRFPAINVMEAAASGCKLTVVPAPQSSAYCVAFNAYILWAYLPKHKVDLVIISGLWTEVDAGSLGVTLAYLRRIGVPVAVSGPVVRYSQPLPLLLARQIDWASPDLARSRRGTGTELTDQTIGKVARRAGVPYVSLYRFMCSSSVCLTEAAPGIPLQLDPSHFSGAGSIRMAEAFDGLLSRFATEPR